MIRISKRIINAIREEGERAYPNECCGCLLGALDEGGADVTAIFPVQNAREAENQYNRFVITPEDFLKAEREAAKTGTDVAGFYHSHPDHPAEPSDYDREHALPVYSYVIVKVSGGMAEDMTGWLLSHDRRRFDREDIMIKEE